jgi:uncharacterized BrkB/YihY/UPF0761 family membrane protein
MQIIFIFLKEIICLIVSNKWWNCINNIIDPNKLLCVINDQSNYIKVLGLLFFFIFFVFFGFAVYLGLVSDLFYCKNALVFTFVDFLLWLLKKLSSLSCIAFVFLAFYLLYLYLLFLPIYLLFCEANF